jgi:hypothetical protein
MSEKLVRKLLELNRAYSELFVAESRERESYHEKHPTNIATFKCMDGRVSLSTLTKTPIGMIRPFRNIGGVFDLGWTVLNEQVADYVRTSVAVKRRKVLFLVTYHFAQGSRLRGCRGHDFDTDRAVASSGRLVEQIRGVFKGDSGIYPILVGVETDRQALIFHGRSGARVPMTDLRDDAGAVTDVIRTLYPDIHPEIIPDLVPLVRGNIRHLADVSGDDLGIEDIEHRERVIATGHGFEWMPHNFALVINDLELSLDDTIGKAAGIIRENYETGRIPEHSGKALLLASVTYEEDGYMRELAIERARYLARLGLESIRKFHPDLDGFFDTLTCVMRWHDRLLEVIDG